MIHIIAGTKAQFIKMMPIMQALDKRGIRYNFIDTGQHAAITKNLIEQFRVRQPDAYLQRRVANVNQISHALGGESLKPLADRFARHFSNSVSGEKRHLPDSWGYADHLNFPAICQTLRHSRGAY